VDNELLVTAC